MFGTIRGPGADWIARKFIWSVKAVLLPAFIAAVLCGGAQAAEEEKQSEGTVKLESVKVTANKMEEDPMDVPQSITAISEIEIEEKGIKSILDVIENVPGMTGFDDFGTRINFRGLNTSLFTQNNPVAMYVDGIGQSGITGFNTSMVNVERVEVLRGPQSTLYGKDTMGAVINVITKNPTNTWEGKVGTEYGSWEYSNTFLSLNGPIAEDKLYLGLSGQYEYDQGWIKNDYPDMEKEANGERTKHLSGYILATPNEDWRIRLSAHHDYAKDHWPNYYVMAPGQSLESFDADDAKHVSYDVKTRQTIEADSHSLKIEYTTDLAKVDSITTHSYQKVRGVSDSDFKDDAAWLGLINFDHTDKESWGQEFRLSSIQTEGFRWTAGVYLDSEEQNQGPYGCETQPGPTRYDSHAKMKSKTQAAFGQVMIPMGESFELTLGGRAQRIEKDVDLELYMGPVGGAQALAYAMQAKKTWIALLPKAALTYDITENWTTYFMYSHGYMPGGFNGFAMNGTVEENTFEPQKSTNYEWGIKAAYDSLRLGASLFYMDIEDIHVHKVVGPVYSTDNAKKAHSQGFEFEATYMPLDTLELNGTLTLTEARYDDYDNGVKIFDGERIKRTPSYAVTLGATYHDPSGFYARAEGRHSGPMSLYDGGAMSYVTTTPHTVLDGKVGYRFSDLDVYAYVDNIANEQHAMSIRTSAVGAVVGLTDPRKIGLGVVYNF